MSTLINPVKNPNKRVNVISKEFTFEDGKVQEAGILMRTTRSIAAQLVAAGSHTYTSKGKLKSFLNKDMKLYRNARFLDNFIDMNDNKVNFTKNKLGHIAFTDKYSGKVYGLVVRKKQMVMMMNKKEIDHTTGKPKTFEQEQKKYQILVLKFPN